MELKETVLPVNQEEKAGTSAWYDLPYKCTLYENYKIWNAIYATVDADIVDVPIFIFTADAYNF